MDYHGTGRTIPKRLTTCPKKSCRSTNVIRVNPNGRVPKYKCMTCHGTPFIEQSTRIAICIKITKDNPRLRDVDDGVINERLFAFWAETDGFAAHIKAFIDENDPDWYRRAVPATTVERDYRREIDGNEDGLNATYRRERLGQTELEL